MTRTPTTQSMVPDNGWHRVPDPDEDPTRPRFISWGKVAIGTELTGVYRGTLEGEWGPYGVLELPSGVRQRFALPTLLGRRLALVEAGQEIRITYRGTQPGKSDKSPYHTFEVESRAPIFLPAAPAGALAPPTDDEEVPF